MLNPNLAVKIRIRLLLFFFVDKVENFDLYHYEIQNQTENLEQRWKTWEKKKWVTLKIFQCDLKFFSVISVSLNKENISERWSWIITVISFVNIFQCDFRVFSVSQKFSVWFSV